MKQKTVGMTLRAVVLALALILVAGSPALPLFDGAAYAQNAEVSDLSWAARPNGTLQLDWTAVDGAESYRLWKGTGSGRSVSWGTAALATIDAPALSYNDSAVTAGMTYSYVVEVYEGDTRLGWSDVINVTMPGGVQAPTAQPVVTLEAVGSDAIRITWTAVAGASHYQVRYWTSGLAGWMDVAADQVERTVTHSGLTAGSQYFYIVRGQNEGGNGPYSGAPGQYDSLTLETVSTTPVLTATHVNRTTVALSWTATPDAAIYTLEYRRSWVAAGALDVTTATTDPWTLVSQTGTTYTHDRATYRPEQAERVMYEYRVRATDSNGITSNYSNTEMVAIPRLGILLGPPGNLAATALNSTTIRVTWTPHPVASYHELRWKAGDGAYSNPFRVDSGSYEHSGLDASTKYTYQLRGMNVNGAGEWTGEVSATTPGAGGPGVTQMPKVTGLTVTDVTEDNDSALRTARLSWDAVDGATHYEIFRFNPRGIVVAWTPAPADSDNLLTNGFISVANAGETAPTWDDVINTTVDSEGAGQTYFYIVSAVEDGIDNVVTNRADNQVGEWSDYRSVTFLDYRPRTPDSITAFRTGPTSAQVRWTHLPSERAGSPPTGVLTSSTLQFRTAETTIWQSLDFPVATNQFHHTGMDNTTVYYYRVRANNAAGSSGWMEAEELRMGNTLPQVTGVRAEDATTFTQAGIRVSWNAVPGVDGYDVQRFRPNDGQWGRLDGTGGANAYSRLGSDTEVTDRNSLFGNFLYVYRVRAQKEGRTGAWSALVSARTSFVSGAGPVQLTTQSIGQTMVRVSWQPVFNAVAYDLQYHEGARDTAYFGAQQPVTVRINSSFSNYIITGLKPGTLYSIRMRAVLPGENLRAWSDPAPSLVWTKLATPVVTAEALNSNSIRLTWSPVANYLTNNTVNYVGIGGSSGSYYVQWRVVDSGVSWAAVAETANCAYNSNTDTRICTLNDGGLSGGAEYEYRVRAHGHADQGGHQSYWDYVRARTPAAGQ